MGALPAALVLISCVSHATWNLLAKRSRITPAFFALANGLIVICGAPLFALGAWRAPLHVPGPVLVCLGVTGICQAAYYVFLSAAYRDGDISRVYPLARTAPVFVVPIAGIVQHRWPTALGAAGIVVAVVGCIAMPGEIRSRGRAGGAGYDRPARAALAAVAAAAASGGYTVADAMGVSLLGRGAPGPHAALVYAYLEWLVTTAVLTPAALKRDGLGAFRRSGSSQPTQLLLIGALIFGTYVLVLWAYALSRTVAYPAAMRQFSIVLGVAGGVVLFKEANAGGRLLASGVIVAGLILVALGS